MKFLKIFIIFVFVATSVYAADWVQTSGPKLDGNYLITNTIQKVLNTTFVVGTDEGGIYRTTNSGSTWTNVLDISTRVWIIEKKSNGHLFAGTELNGVYRSTNNGTSWEQVFSANSMVFDINFDNLGNIYIGIEAAGIYKSTDNGSNWSLLWETELTPSAIFYMNDILYVGTLSDGVYFSDDGGQTFNSLEFSGDIIWDITGDGNSIIVCTESSGAYISDDGVNFDSYAFPNSSTSKFFKSSINSTEYLLVDYGVYRKTSESNTWESFNDGFGSIDVYHIDEDGNGYLLAATAGNSVYKSVVSNLDPEILTIGDVNSEYCAGEFFNISYTVQGGFGSNNIFQIQLSDDLGSFTNPTIIGSTQSQESGSMDVVIPYNTPQGANYQIRVVSTEPALIGPNTDLFIVNELNTALLTPVHQVIDVALKPTFTWEANDCSLSYTLQISTFPDFSDIEYQIFDLNTTSYTMLVNLEKGTKYYWRVVLLSNLGDELYTDAFEFTTLSTVTQEINLNTGWNLISSYITTDNMNIANYLSSITDGILIVKNPSGQAYIPQYNINNIGNWNNAHGYQAYMTTAKKLELTGEGIVPENFVINLNAGWNKISYTRNSNLIATTAFAQLTDNNNLLIAKNFAGQAYIPSFGINNLGNLIPGQGYSIYVTNADSFSFPAN